jgi:hypothetical protein
MSSSITATQIVVDGIKFDSVFESKVYSELLGLTIHYGKHLELQHPVLLKPATTIYPAINWKCDFRITNFTVRNCNERQDYSKSILIEAKGTLRGANSREFIRSMKFLEYLNPTAYANLILVCQTNETKRHAQRIFKLMTICTLNDVLSVVNQKLTQLILTKGM